MTDDRDGDRNAYIAALQRAARMERSQTLRRLLLSLFLGRRTVEVAAWAPASRPALGEGR